jgi:hypothetical protein
VYKTTCFAVQQQQLLQTQVDQMMMLPWSAWSLQDVTAASSQSLLMRYYSCATAAHHTIQPPPAPRNNPVLMLQPVAAVARNHCSMHNECDTA